MEVPADPVRVNAEQGKFTCQHSYKESLSCIVHLTHLCLHHWVFTKYFLQHACSFISAHVC